MKTISKPSCPDCDKPSSWVEEFGTGKKIAKVCDDCHESNCRQIDGWMDQKYGTSDPWDFDREVTSALSKLIGQGEQ